MAQKEYSRLSINEREILFKRLAERKRQKEIAKELSRHPSTISREIRRAGMNRSSYLPFAADQNSQALSFNRRRKYKILENQELANFVEEMLKAKWSPEQIAGTLKKVSPVNTVSHESIYRYIYSIENKDHRNALINCLRQSRKRRRPRKQGKSRRTTIRNLVSIHERPIEVETREEPGHWEGDLIIGKDHKSAIGTLVERTTRFVIIVSFEGNHSTSEVVRGFAAALGIFPPHMKKSLTYDRGTEMSGHQWFTKITGIPVFFADPYSPWQRGTNENTNGLIRQYFPKGSDFRDVDDPVYASVVLELNQRPRKTLDFCNPKEMFQWFLKSSGTDVHDFYASSYMRAV